MKYSFVIAVAIIATACTTTAVDCGKIVSANATLRDGSSVKGEFCAKSISGSTIFSEKLKLDPALVKSLDFVGTNGAAKVSLVNDDKFAMTVANDDFTIKSILGDLKIPRASFKSLRMSQRSVATGAAAEEGLVFYCTFDDEAAITSPVVGPNGTVWSREFVDGKVNGAVHVPVGGSAGAFTLPAGTLGEEGCIEFWAKLDAGRDVYRDCDPRIIFIKSPAGWFTIEYSSNNGSGRGGFCVRCFGLESVMGGSCGGFHRYADVIHDVAAWHHYAVSWENNAMTIYIDGEELKGAFRTGEGRVNEEKLKSGQAELGLPQNKANPFCGGTEPRSAFSIDELKIWNHAKSEFAL